MERSLEKYSIKMILIFTLLLGVLLWVNGPARTASAQVPPIPTPTPIVDSQTIEIVEGETVDLGDIPFQSTQVSGNIQTADGESVRYAEFQIYGASSNCSNEYSERTYGTTDEIGHFSMGGLPAGDYCLMLEADGGTGGLFGPLPVRFTIEEGGEALDLGTIAYREPNKIIQGVVLSESGEGVANVTVGASHRNQFYGWDNTTTDADGRFTLGVVGGAWDVSISPGNREESSGTTEQSWFSDNRHQIVAFAHSEIEETTDVEFQVQFTDATITGRIVAPDGTPITAQNMAKIAMSLLVMMVPLASLSSAAIMKSMSILTTICTLITTNRRHSRSELNLTIESISVIYLWARRPLPFKAKL